MSTERDTRDVVEQWKRVDSEFHEPDTYGDSHTLYQLHIVGHRMADEITALRAERDRLREALDAAQWSERWVDPDGLPHARCPVCACAKHQGHRPDCIIGVALKGEEADRGPGEVTHG